MGCAAVGGDAGMDAGWGGKGCDGVIELARATVDPLLAGTEPREFTEAMNAWWKSGSKISEATERLAIAHAG